MDYYDGHCGRFLSLSKDDPQSPDHRGDLAFLAARAHYINGVGYYERDSVVQACEEYLKALEMMEDNYTEKKLVGKKAKFMAYTYNRLGDMFSRQFMMEAAIMCYKNSCKFSFISPVSSYSVSNALYRIGKQFDMKGNLDSANYYYSQALSRMPDTTNHFYRNVVSNQSLLLYRLTHQPKASLKRLKQMAVLAENEEEKLVQSVQPAENMDAYLLSFKEKLLSAEKGGERITLEEARLNLGNLLNFDFDDANYATNILHYDTIYVNLALDDNLVELSELAVTYQEAFSQVLATFNAVNIPEKTVFGIHCETEAEAKSDNVGVEITMITRGFSEDPLKLEFEEGECWRTVNYGGSCDETGDNFGAFQMIAMIATNRLSVNNWGLDCANGQRIVFSDNLDVYHMEGYNSPLDSSSPVGGHELYVNYHVYDTCLCYETLNYFLDKTVEIGHEHVPYHHIIYAYASHLNTPPTSNYGWQVLEVAYRKYWCSGEPAQIN